MFAIVTRSLVLVGFAIVFAQKRWKTSTRVTFPRPELKSVIGRIDDFGARAPPETLHEIHEQLEALLEKCKNLSEKKMSLKKSRYLNLIRSINVADSVERECLIKIIGIPGLSHYYYMTVMKQLASRLGVPFKESDVIMLKRLNSQPNLIDVPEVAYTNISYPIFVRFTTSFSKKFFLNRWYAILSEKNDANYLNRVFRCDVTIDSMDDTEKIQIHGFRTMNVPNQYRLMDQISKVINYKNWRENVQTIYQSRYTKFLAPDGMEQLQTEGIIVKLRSRALKMKWMRQTRLDMLARPKDWRRLGYIINLPHHIKYKNTNFTVFVDEHLNTHKKNLFLIARGRCKTKHWSRCWTWDSTIYVKKYTNSSTLRIHTFEDIDKYIV